ncbi:hypothetical protein PUNSTDRAFT_132721 [Punctularia strigosozonata HHB-11173 SS5]|uniref:uncharacterized protein n=1 Tax=Punctularia strigosozonata (strain HHB-11173) TaxID=741275 RepID=UPI00044177EA|nr:uncharacterized protein PUNSTDRAFT_132721 [Punctularia strigosozonata HHB-11173 SS5]EIN10635.1 hypothetical protein PUNSTDRAFT_132721 [Punctularia strigosozonata HHB-11173 SS5]
MSFSYVDARIFRQHSFPKRGKGDIYPSSTPGDAFGSQTVRQQPVIQLANGTPLRLATCNLMVDTRLSEGACHLPPLDASRTTSRDEGLPSISTIGVFDSPRARFQWSSLQAYSQMSAPPVISVAPARSTVTPQGYRSDSSDYRHSSISPAPSDASSRSLKRREPDDDVRAAPRQKISRASSAVFNTLITPLSACTVNDHRSSSRRHRSISAGRTPHARQSKARPASSSAKRPAVTMNAEDGEDSDGAGIMSNVSDAGFSVLDIGEAENFWKDFITNKDGKISCKWVDRATGVCGYSSKKHLVRRHIENTHLKIKSGFSEWCSSDADDFLHL